jgi:hypothetical protein
LPEGGESLRGGIALRVTLERLGSRKWEPQRWRQAVTSRKLNRERAHIVLYHPDVHPLHAKAVEVAARAHAQQMRALTGHEPLTQRPWFWLNRTFTAQFDASMHWAHNADVPLYL